MSRDLLLPSSFDQVHETRGTPTLAVLVTGGAMIAVILLLDLEGLIKTASTLKLMLFLLVNVAVIVMRESRLQNYRPSFKSPLYPWVQVLGIVASAVLIAAMGIAQIAMASGFVVLSLGWYVVYGRRKRSSSASALIHVVERIAGRDLTSGSLGSELSQIIRERDGIGEDRFDRLVQGSIVLDLEGPTELEDFVREAASHMAERVELTEDDFVAQIMERERDTSTALTPLLAIPHAVIEGESRFEMLIARSKAGVNFSDKAPKVQTIFVLMGSPDERNFHLQALMAIAQVAQEPKFHERWLRASDEADLKDLLLLSSRARRNT